MNKRAVDPSKSGESADHQSNLSRRAFLGAAGAGAATGGAALLGLPDAASADPSVVPVAPPGSSGPGRFGRMFPHLEPFAEPSDELTAALIEMSKPGGILDANDPVEVGPVRLITEPELSPNNRDNPRQSAGTTFMGQFIDHDITRDGGSTLGQPQSLGRSVNLATPRIDLDSVYGGDPSASKHLYEDDGLHFRIESGGLFEDLPRTADGTAIIAEPRNDENIIISGLQVALMLFHNNVLDHIATSNRFEGRALFVEAQRQVRWHWQWIVANEFLPQIIGAKRARWAVRKGPRHYRPRELQIPVEFQGAAYRFGHSMVRPSYRANLAGDNGNPFFAMVFDPNEPESNDPNSLIGGHRAPRRFVGWQTFFDFGDGEVKPNKRSDTKISSPLFRLPSFTIDLPRGGDAGPTSIATRNLLRHVTWQLPSGQAIASTLGLPQLSADDLSQLDPFGANLVNSTPLWYYVLREAEIMQNGLRLGPVGGAIVGDVFGAMLHWDGHSFVHQRVNVGGGRMRSWRPWLPSAGGSGQFEMTDLLTFAGVDPASRGQ